MENQLGFVVITTSAVFTQLLRRNAPMGISIGSFYFENSKIVPRYAVSNCGCEYHLDGSRCYSARRASYRSKVLL